MEINFNDFKPILVIPAVPQNNGIRFLCEDNQLDIKGEISKTLWEILSHCNGYNTIKEIEKESKINKNTIKTILNELAEIGIINDSREQYKHFHTVSNYPSKYTRNLSYCDVVKFSKSKRKEFKKGEIISYKLDKTSKLFDLQTQRQSCRNFSQKKKVNLTQLGNICEYAYSLSHHSTPSGGALYPLKIFCIVVKDQTNLKAGYYEYDNEKGKLILYNDQPDLEYLKFCYNDDQLAFGSPIQIIIAGDLNRQTYKYSNRGYRLTLIEAGHVAQNILLYCEEQKLKTCELGGLLDRPLIQELNLAENIYPLLGICVGYEGEEQKTKYNELLIKLEDNLVGDNKLIKRCGINNLNIEDACFYGAWSKYGKNGTKIAGATGTSYNEAVCKAIIEGYERNRSNTSRVDFVGIAKNNKFFKPEEIAPLSIEQRKMMNLAEYNKGDSIEWTKDMTGSFYVPTDFVYYGHKKNNRLFHSDSSGIAAYTDYETAKRKACAELIERDAIMRSWYAKESPMHVNEKQIPIHIKKRITHWKNKNRELHLLRLESKYLPVFLAVIVGEEYPTFVSGAAASIGNYEDAMLKAVQEAEYNLLLALKSPIIKCPKKEEIFSPVDHGNYYHYKENSNTISWLWENKSECTKIKNLSYDFEKIYKDLDMVFVDLSESENDMIKVVRAVSKKLIPISFGYKGDYFNHPEVKEIKKRISRDIPHYFA